MYSKTGIFIHCFSYFCFKHIFWVPRFYAFSRNKKSILNFHQKKFIFYGHKNYHSFASKRNSGISVEFGRSKAVLFNGGKKQKQKQKKKKKKKTVHFCCLPRFSICLVHLHYFLESILKKEYIH